MYVDRYDNCLEEVAEICKPMKETLVKCLDLKNDYNIDKFESCLSGLMALCVVAILVEFMVGVFR